MKRLDNTARRLTSSHPITAAQMCAAHFHCSMRDVRFLSDYEQLEIAATLYLKGERVPDGQQVHGDIMLAAQILRTEGYKGLRELDKSPQSRAAHA